MRWLGGLRNWLLVKLAAGDTVIINAGFDRATIYRSPGAFIYNSRFHSRMQVKMSDEPPTTPETDR